MRRIGLSLAVSALLFSVLAAANAADSTSVGELSAPQIEEELQVWMRGCPVLMQ